MLLKDIRQFVACSRNLKVIEDRMFNAFWCTTRTELSITSLCGASTDVVVFVYNTMS